MIKNKPTFWTNFVLFSLAAFVPLLVALALLYGRIGIPGLFVVIAVFVVIGLPIAFVCAQAMTRPIIKLASAAQQIAAAVDEGAWREYDLTVHRAQGTTELGDVEKIVGHVLSVLRSQVNELDTLYAISQTVTQKLDYQEALEAVLTAVAQVLEYDAAEIAILDGDKLRVDGWRGKDGLLNTTGRLYVYGRGLAGTIAESREPLLVPIVTEDSTDDRRTLARGAMISEMIQRTERVVVNSFLGVPLLVNDELVGVMNLVHRTTGHFTEKDEHQLAKLMDQACIAIHNALQVRAREATLKLQIRELQIRIDESQKKKEVEAVISSEYFKELREQADVLRRVARDRRGRNS